MMRISTTHYENSNYGKTPRGFGKYFFVLEELYRDRWLRGTLSIDEYHKAIFSPAASTYTEAKKAAKKHFPKGSVVAVLP